MKRHKDWIEQATCDLRLARTARDGESFEWACFASHQAAEKAIKGLVYFLDGDPWGHSLVKLLDDVAHSEAVEPAVRDSARRLDRFYIPTRYPNGFDAGKPADYFVKDDADAAISDAEHILAWVDERVR